MKLITLFAERVNVRYFHFITGESQNIMNERNLTNERTNEGMDV